MSELNKNYNPSEVEEKWLKVWLENKLFKSQIDLEKESFSIALPPPNVTGSLHMGHAFGDTIQDVLIRYHRMNGKNVLWQGGTDHAGIGTQVVVKKEISKTEKEKRQDLRREEFLDKVWDWKKKSGDQIINQMQKLGCAMDYDRTCFTMDEKYSRAVRKVFVQLYNDGLIYKGKRIVNWCPKCLTSISDLEVETEPSKGKLYHILYPFNINDISSGGLIVATSRPETLFGDVAVCVNPKDDRYKDLIGKNVFIPIINKSIPIIADSAVELDFGTGCLKITPAHDANDYEIFERNKNTFQDKNYIEIMSEKGAIQDKNNLGIPGDIVGQERFKAREITVAKLEELGFLKEVKEYEQPSAKHDRCSTVIEPFLSEQWYVKMKPLAKRAIEVVENGEIKFLPERYKDHYLNWLNNIRDWCISRQLWWGHQIPVWYKKGEDKSKKENWFVSENPPDHIENYEQDEDVLDTWFSSALWPFVTLEWPDHSYFKEFYPTSVLATAREIINLWVSRMVFMGLKFTGEIPFKTVLIHPVIQTPDGKRMSKSKGNAIDPLEMIEKYGADANRFWYFSVGIMGNQDVRFPGSKNKDGKWESATLEQYKRFSNKLWNASRFILEKLDPKETYDSNLDFEGLIRRGFLINENLTPADKWIILEFNRLIKNIETNFAQYDFQIISKELYEFIWDKFCDWYIEIAKIQLSKENLNTQTQHILFYILNNLLKLLHPIMPFITEELWSMLPIEEKKYLLNQEYPHYSIGSLHWIDADEFNYIINLTREIRNIRQTANLPWTEVINVYVYSELSRVRNLLHQYSYYTEDLAKVRISIQDSFKQIKPSIGSWVSESHILKILYVTDAENIPVNNQGTRFQISIDDPEKIKGLSDQYTKKKTQHEKDLQLCLNKLNNPNFINNAAKEKVDEVQTLIKELENQIKTIEENVSLLK